MNISRPSLIRLARRAGIKSLSADCFDLLRSIIIMKLEQVLDKSVIMNQQRGTKILMQSDIYEALSILEENLTQSNNLGTVVMDKKN